MNQVATMPMSKVQELKKLSSIEQALIKTLLYFDIFKHPLKEDELYFNCHHGRATSEESKEAINALINKKLIKYNHGFVYVNKDDSIVAKRKKGNQKAENYFKKATSYSKLISYFPFVKAVFISGSLAKGVVDEKGDIDYFIITEPNRLWLSRTSLIIFKKIFLLNSKKYFCVNYFIDSKNLEIQDKNIFTATELVFAKPMYNPDLCNAFFEANTWKREYYPNKERESTSGAHPLNKSFIKKMLEFVFKGSLGEKIDSWCFKHTLNYWKKKFPDFNEERFDLNLRSRKNVSKHHPNAFQERVLKQLEEKTREFELKHNIQL